MLQRWLYEARSQRMRFFVTAASKKVLCCRWSRQKLRTFHLTCKAFCQKCVMLPARSNIALISVYDKPSAQVKEEEDRLWKPKRLAWDTEMSSNCSKAKLQKYFLSTSVWNNRILCEHASWKAKHSLPTTQNEGRWSKMCGQGGRDQGLWVPQSAGAICGPPTSCVWKVLQNADATCDNSNVFDPHS